MWEGISDEHEREIYKLIGMLPKDFAYLWCLDSLPKILSDLIPSDDVDNIKTVYWYPGAVQENLLVLGHEEKIVFDIKKLGKFTFVFERRQNA